MKKWSQTQLYTGAPHSLSFDKNTMLTFDDFGVSNGAAVRQLALRSSASSGRSTAYLLARSSKGKNKLTSINSARAVKNLTFVNMASRYSRQLVKHANHMQGGLIPSSFDTIPSQDFSHTLGWPLGVWAAENAESKNAGALWALASIPRQQVRQVLLDSPVSVGGKPSLSLSASSSPYS